ncbi:MAG: HAMP domain-containing sensor histidine kinase [Candidatus Gracilibacteria bacterium]|nr:HAMP domain-containing sensor histidine kinase [Candidatus Gracilibacteria bacterium]
MNVLGRTPRYKHMKKEKSDSARNLVKSKRLRVGTLLSGEKSELLESIRRLEEKNEKLAAENSDLKNATLSIKKKEKDDELKEFIKGCVNHDINNILAQVQGYSDLLESSLEFLSPEDIKRYLRIISSGIKKIGIIKENYLKKISKIFEMKYQYEPEFFDLIPILCNIEEMFDNLKNGKDITINYDIKGKIGKICDIGDETVSFIGDEGLFLCNIFPNLYKNAIEAAPKGSNINIRFYTDETGRDIFEIENEPEMPKDILDKLFKHRVSSKGDLKNRGFGLAFANKLIKSQKYNLSCRTIPGKTIFTVK